MKGLSHNCDVFMFVYIRGRCSTEYTVLITGVKVKTKLISFFIRLLHVLIENAVKIVIQGISIVIAMKF